MALTFESVSEARRQANDPVASVGVILFDGRSYVGGRWVAALSGEIVAEGVGAPENVPDGLWVLSLSHDEAMSLRPPRQTVFRATGWLRQEIDAIQGAYGFHLLDLPVRARLLSAIVGRCFALVQEVLGAHKAECGFAASESLIPKLQSASSLATAIASIAAIPIKRSGDPDREVQKEFQKTYHGGIFLTKEVLELAGDRQVPLRFHFPRLSYAQRICSDSVPTKTHWRRASRAATQSQEDFCQDVEALGGPAIFRAVCRPLHDYIPEHIQAFGNSRSVKAGTAFRTRFLGAEVEVLEKHYQVDVQGVMVGQDWAESCIGRQLRTLEDKAGGPIAARSSVAVGLVAENILAASTRSINRDSPASRAESIWIAARDRCAMIEAMDALSDIGGAVVSGSFGNIEVQCPEDVEVLMVVLMAAWENGLVLRFDDCERLAALGVTIPSEAELWGGSEADLLLAQNTHRLHRRSLWDNDKVMDLPANLRQTEFETKQN